MEGITKSQARQLDTCLRHAIDELVKAEYITGAIADYRKLPAWQWTFAAELHRACCAVVDLRSVLPDEVR